ATHVRDESEIDLDSHEIVIGHATGKQRGPGRDDPSGGRYRPETADGEPVEFGTKERRNYAGKGKGGFADRVDLRDIETGALKMLEQRLVRRRPAEAPGIYQHGRASPEDCIASEKLGRGGVQVSAEDRWATLREFGQVREHLLLAPS